MQGQRPLPAVVIVAVTVAATVAPRGRRRLAFRLFGGVGVRGWFHWRAGRRFGRLARFRRLGVVSTGGMTGAAACPSTGMMTVTVTATCVRDERRLRGSGRFRGGLGRRTRGWSSGAGGRFRCRCRNRSGGGLLDNRQRTGGRTAGRAFSGRRDVAGRADWGRVGDDNAFRSQGLWPRRRRRSPRAVSRRASGRFGALPVGDASGHRTITARSSCRGRDGSVANRPLLVSEARNRGSGNQRPTLVEGQGDHREADRRGKTEQRQRCAAGPFEQPLPEDAGPGGRAQPPLLTFVMHRYVHRPARFNQQSQKRDNPNIDSSIR